MPNFPHTGTSAGTPGLVSFPKPASTPLRFFAKPQNRIAPNARGWGGELPSLLPDLCLEHADVVFGGLFEPIADAFIHDPANRGLQRKILRENTEGQVPANIDFSLLPQPENYFSFIGYPLETSRGCTENCIFAWCIRCRKKLPRKRHRPICRGHWPNTRASSSTWWITILGGCRKREGSVAPHQKQRRLGVGWPKCALNCWT